jgi:branched-subunit amino acid transport protein AzlD
MKFANVVSSMSEEIYFFVRKIGVLKLIALSCFLLRSLFFLFFNILKKEKITPYLARAQDWERDIIFYFFILFFYIFFIKKCKNHNYLFKKIVTYNLK